VKYTSLLLIFLLVILAAGCSDNKVTGDDTGNGASYTVSGKILYDSGVGIENTLVNIFGNAAGSTGDFNINISISTDSQGIFRFSNIKNGSYTITPLKAGFVFAPERRQITVNGSNLSVPLFTGAPVGGGNNGGSGEYTVSGRITDTSGNGIDGISVGIAGEDIGIHVLTDTQGYFTFRNIPSGTYTIAPGREGYSFSPSFTTVIVRGNDVTVSTFVASPSNGGGGDDEDGLTGFAGTNVYYPMSASASWTIQRADTDFTYGSVEVYEYTLIVNGTKLINDREYWLLKNDDGDFDSFIRIEDDVVYTFTEFADVYTPDDYIFKNRVHMKPGAVNSLNTHDRSSNDDWDPNKDELPILQLNLSPDTAYDIMGYTNSDFGASFTLTWLGEYIGTENVTVTAGTFTNCKKYEITYDAVAVGGGTAVREITTTVLWLAPDVGVVKSTEIKTDGEKTIWSREEELIGFSIP